ncbi:MAG: ABC transporter permease subunit, partial [Lachnospiraceae bacterium]
MLKKEFTESIRTKKLLIIMCIFALFGIMNPAIAKLTPVLMETLQNSGMGIVITDMTVDATMSWQQFFKNMPMALIVVVIMYGGIFTSEYQRHTLTLVVTKGLARWKIVVAKSVLLATVWTAGYWMNFGITYFYTRFYWDNSIMNNLLFSAVCYWIFGLFIVAVLVLFSTFANSSGLVLLGVG